MSSILDALNKLEDEKDQENLIPEDIDARSAAEEMLGHDIMRDKVTMQINPMMLIGGGMIFLTILVAIVAVSVTIVLKPDAPTPRQIASISVTPPATPVENEIIEEEPIVEEVLPVQNPTPITPPVEQKEIESTPIKPDPIVEVVAPEPSPVQEAPTIEAPAPVTEQPVVEKTPPVSETPKPTPPVQEKQVLPEPIEITQVLIQPIEPTTPRVQTAPPTPTPTPKPEPEAPVETNVATLPPISPGMLNQYGLNEFTINMVNPKSDRNPYGSAIINRKKVFEDSYIAGSQLRLHKVVNNGISVEESRTGDKYFISF